MKIKNLILKVAVFSLLGILMYIYFRDKKTKFEKLKYETTQGIIEKFNIREENFFKNEELVKEYKETQKIEVKKNKESVKKDLAQKEEIGNKRYYLQIATYSVKENALKMQESLKSLDNFLIKNSNINKEYYVVVSREFSTRKAVEELEGKVLENFKELKPLIKMRYDDGESSKY